MGKYMRKGKGVGKMAVIEGALGVRTRARALALQRDPKQVVTHSSTSTSESMKQHEARNSLECHTAPVPVPTAEAPQQENYMELRSRRLEKVSRCSISRAGEQAADDAGHALVRNRISKTSNSEDKSPRIHMSPHSSTRHGFAHPAARSNASPTRQLSLQSSAIDAGAILPRRVTPTASTSNSASVSARRPLGILTRHQRQELASLASREDMDIDAEVALSRRAGSSHVDMNTEVEQFFGESPMIAGPSNKDRHRRRTRESTPDSYGRSMEAPGSTSRTRRAGRSQGRSLSAPPFNRANEAPSSSEIEAFFQSAEQQERRKFIERYNFDPVNERPLRGRYEWTSM